MLKFEKTVTPSPEQWEMTVEAVRNVTETTAPSDSYKTHVADPETLHCKTSEFFIGENDMKLIKGLLQEEDRRYGLAMLKSIRVTTKGVATSDAIEMAAFVFFGLHNDVTAQFLFMTDYEALYHWVNTEKNRETTNHEDRGVMLDWIKSLPYSELILGDEEDGHEG